MNVAVLADRLELSPMLSIPDTRPYHYFAPFIRLFGVNEAAGWPRKQDGHPRAGYGEFTTETDETNFPGFAGS